jgi:hypothetical protein
MGTQLTAEQLDAVTAGVAAARQFAQTGVMPELDCGWYPGTAEEANFCNDYQEQWLVALGHRDSEVLRTARESLPLQGVPTPAVFNLNLNAFLFVERPGRK